MQATYVSFTAKGYLVNQLLQEGWGWDAALVHADRLFSADGDHPAQHLEGDELQNVKTYIAYYDEQPDDEPPTIFEKNRGCGMCMDSQRNHARPCSCPCHLGEPEPDDNEPRVEETAVPCGGLEVHA